jgi:hypothetical protein
MAILPTALKERRHGFGSAAATDIHSDFVSYLHRLRLGATLTPGCKPAVP